MSRIERDIAVVRAKLTFQQWLNVLSWSVLLAAGVVWLGLLVQRLTTFAPAKPGYWLLAVVVATLVVSVVLAMRRRPSALSSAIAIDERLGLREKYSTALVLRRSDDPFARAAIDDAEQTASKVDLRGKFALSMPRVAPYAMAALLFLLLNHWLLPQYNVFGREDPGVARRLEQQKRADAQQKLDAIARTIEQAEAKLGKTEAIEQAKQQLADLRQLAARDPEAAARRASAAQNNLQERLREQARNTQQFAQARENQRQFQNNLKAPTEQGSVADAHRSMSQGDFQQALQQLRDAVNNFDKQTDEQKQQTAEQMQRLAGQLQQMANDPAQQQRMQEQLQRMGLDQQQSEQAMKLLKDAANGDPQAQQQLQEMAKQAMQQMNNGQGPTPQQQEQIQKMLNQLQAQAGSQQQAQQMAEAAQKLAQAMQQAAQNSQQSGSGQSQPGGNNPADAQQQMADAMAAMQQALDEMDAIQQDARQMQALAGNGNNAARGQGGPGQWRAGDPNRPGGGMGGPGQGGGGRAPIAPAPFDTQAQKSPSQNDERGRILARTFVRDGQTVIGESKAELRQAAQAEQERAAEEVEQQRISRQAQRATREYFKALTD
jgi:hypothetical protein